MTLWLCVPGGDNDRERIVFETNDIDQMDAAIEQYWTDEVEQDGDEYFMIENNRYQFCFNNPEEWHRAFRAYFEPPRTLAQFLGNRLLP